MVYQKVITAIRGVSLDVFPGQIVVLLGTNGAGKTTTLRAVSGFLGTDDARVSDGQIRFDGEAIENWLPQKVAGRGIALIPERNKIFETLTVIENLEATVSGARRAMSRRQLIETDVRPLPALGLCQEPVGRLFVGRRTADAGDRNGLGRRAAAAAGRRDEPGTCAAGHRRAVRASGEAEEGTGTHHPAGGAERPSRLGHRRLRLRHRERSHRAGRNARARCAATRMCRSSISARAAANSGATTATSSSIAGAGDGMADPVRSLARSVVAALRGASSSWTPSRSWSVPANCWRSSVRTARARPAFSIASAGFTALRRAGSISRDATSPASSRTWSPRRESRGHSRMAACSRT